MTQILEYTERANKTLLPKMFQDSSDKTYITIRLMKLIIIIINCIECTLKMLIISETGAECMGTL